jgi:hypothetical protein
MVVAAWISAWNCGIVEYTCEFGPSVCDGFTSPDKRTQPGRHTGYSAAGDVLCANQHLFVSLQSQMLQESQWSCGIASPTCAGSVQLQSGALMLDTVIPAALSGVVPSFTLFGTFGNGEEVGVRVWMTRISTHFSTLFPAGTAILSGCSFRPCVQT